MSGEPEQRAVPVHPGSAAGAAPALRGDEAGHHALRRAPPPRQPSLQDSRYLPTLPYPTRHCFFLFFSDPDLFFPRDTNSDA